MFTSISAKISGKTPEELKVIWRQIENKRLFYFGAALSLISTGITAVVPYIYGRLIDKAIAPVIQWRVILFFLIFWLILSLVRDFLSRIEEKITFTLAMDARQSFHFQFLAFLFDLPLWFHKEKKIGAVIGKIDRGGDGVFNLISIAAFSTLPRFISLFGVILITFFIEWRLSLIIFLMAAIYIFATAKYTNKIIFENKKAWLFWEKLYGDLYDAVENIFSVKSFTNENYEKRKNKLNFKRAGNADKKVQKYEIKLSAAQQTASTLGFIAVFIGGVLLITLKEITFGDFVMLIGYFNLAMMPLSNLSTNYQWLKKSFLAISRVLKILKNQPEADYPSAKDIGKIQGKVVFQNVSFKYKKGGEILKDVSFSVEPGEMAALVGESGVGKSTLVSLISRYYLPNEGKIFIDGNEIRRVKFRSLREQMAVVPQEVALFNDTVKNNIAYGKIGASDEEIIAAAKAANADEFIEKFAKKYKQIVGERGVKLSTGQKQRIAIARAILRDPRILILDEATAALDSVSEKLVQDALRNLIKGRTVFVIAHRLSTIVHADKIIVLEGGKIVEIGRHEDLIKQEGIYKKFWELQTRVEEAKPAHLLNGIIEER